MNRRVLLVGALLVLAGCSALGGAGQATDRPTLTPAPVPTASPTPTDRPTLAPGLTSSGIVDLEALVAAHVRAARNTSYVWTVREADSRPYRNGTADHGPTQRVVYVDESRYLREVSLLAATVDGRRAYLQDYARYADGDDEYATWTASLTGETTYRHVEDPAANGRFARLAADPLLEYLALREATVTRVTVDGQTHYRITGTRDTLLRYGTVEDYRATAVVQPDGFVRELDVFFAAYRGSGRTEVSYRFAYTDIGTATLDRPAWVATAQNETGER
ncbi:MAG: hypothetical protein ABEI39_04665 [Halobacteriales archaeon]